MPKFLTAEDEFSDIVVPEGGDARTAASVEPAFQGLTNRITYLRNRIKVASYSLLADEIGEGELFSLTEVSAAEGYELADNEVTVPSAGRYLVILNALLAHHETDPFAVARVDVLLGGDSVAQAVGYRHAALTLIPITTIAVVEITDPETEVITVVNALAGNDLSIGTTGLMVGLTSTLVVMGVDDA